MNIKNTDTFPLWSFGYMTKPDFDTPTKVITSRGRTWQEAWTCIQQINQSFLEPKKVGLRGTVAMIDKEDYSSSHKYDWLHDAPLWLKQQQGAFSKIW